MLRAVGRLLEKKTSSNLRKEPFSWDGPDESPVWVEDDRPPAQGDEADSGAFFDQTEVPIRGPQDSLARQGRDAERTVDRGADEAGALASGLSVNSRRAQVVAAAVALVLACSGAFLHGWQQGSRSVVGPDRVSERQACEPPQCFDASKTV